MEPGGAARARPGSPLPAHAGADDAFLQSLRDEIRDTIMPALKPTVGLRVIKPDEHKWLASELSCVFDLKRPFQPGVSSSVSVWVAVGFYIEETNAARKILLARLPTPQDFDWDSLYSNRRSLISAPSSTSVLTSAAATTDGTATLAESTATLSIA